MRLSRFQIALTFVFAGIATGFADEVPLKFLLRDGSVIVGKLDASSKPGHFRVVSSVFESPLEFESDALVETRPIRDASAEGPATSPVEADDVFAVTLRDQSPVSYTHLRAHET